MTELKKYEILDALPTYGPMYIPVTENGETFYSDGFPVRFYKSDGTEWVANFKPGWTSLKAVFEFNDCGNLLVIAYGACYLMNPEQTKPISFFGMNCSAVLMTDTGRFVLHDEICITIIEANGTFWITERISWDGLKDLKLENNTVTGLSYDPMNDSDEWVSFTYDIDTRKLTGGSFNRYKVIKKAWWKIW